jgi:hypothetical protein
VSLRARFMRAIRCLAIWALVWCGNVSAVTTALTYQGSLEDLGLPANGPYDFQFQLKTVGGANIGAAITLNDVVVVGGVFTVQLDFGTAAFTGADRNLGVAVRPGASIDAYTALTPDAHLNAAPYAQYANNAALADVALDVPSNTIDENEINTGAVSARTIAAGAVGSSELASDSVGIVNLIGANYTSPANISVTIGATSCGTFDLSVSGGFAVGDVVVLNTLTDLPSNISFTALQVVAANTVKVKICNAGTAAQSVSNLQIRMISLR